MAMSILRLNLPISVVGCFKRTQKDNSRLNMHGSSVFRRMVWRVRLPKHFFETTFPLAQVLSLDLSGIKRLACPFDYLVLHRNS